ncbi:MalY/PatB family protein [Oceanobacillus neutriphilus]|uniref:cysteine-S-conjugate beta-lyase n=1 Tax=Oceanobacillus neutriphilus TaxID=531815 RepID=A0ABQ2NND2_9BACI|nr:MalY/PatB family protein [Oceanobacillus neutriphilus]GGP07751.1 aminotransferase [Oceanobacillus neutriphilus]
MFDELIDRRKTNSAKWEEAIRDTQSEDVIPLSVADMDFPTTNEVIEAMEKAANHGIYGYTNLSERYFQAVQEWMNKRYAWEVNRSWIVFCPRIIQAVSLIIQNFTNVGDRIVVQTPLYQPLQNAVELNDRTLVTNPLRYKNESYEMDFEDLERKFASGAKVFILCSPHNPVGRVWNEEELIHLSNLCVKYDVLLISDEVHADFTWDKPYIPIGKVKGIEDKFIVCTSPAKTFNIPGLEVSNIIIPNQQLREKFQHVLKQTGFHNPVYFSALALEQAYLYGEDWIADVKSYIYENYEFIRNYIAAHFPELHIVHWEGTYMLWIDYSSTGLNEKAIRKWLFNESKVAVSLGSSFSTDGEGFFRINIATQRARLQEALHRMKVHYPKIRVRD